MLTPLDAPEILDREFLEVRARLLQVAATLDRLDRAPGDVAGDARREKIVRGLAILASAGDDRAERIQLLFSLPFDEQWKNGATFPNRPR